MRCLSNAMWSQLRLVLLTFAVIGLQWSASFGDSDEAADETPLHEHPTIVAMLQTNNAYRAQVGLAGQQIDAQLTQAAQDHASYMASTHVFSHYANGNPQARAQRYGYPGYVQENIAMGQANVASAFQAWRASGAHWAAITGGAPRAGFGSALSRSGTPFWVGLYGF